jgi:hypothetical protein
VHVLQQEYAILRVVFNGPPIAPSEDVKGVVYIAFAVLLAACKVGEGAAPDGPTQDGSTGSAGLNVSWSSTPEIPGDLGSNIRLNSATFKLDTLRVIGDTGDSHTTKSDFDVTWSDGVKPNRITFADAPTGLYSRVSIQADGHIINDSYQIKGTVMLGVTTYDFEIHDRNALNVSLAIDQMLQPGQSTTVKLQLQVQAAIQAIDWSLITPDDHTLELDTSDPQMPTFRMNLVQGFVIDTSGGAGS